MSRRRAVLCALCALGFAAIAFMISRDVGIAAIDDRVHRLQAGIYNQFYVFADDSTQVLSPYTDAAVLATTAAVLSLRRRDWAPLRTAVWTIAICSVAVLDFKYGVFRKVPGSKVPMSQGFPSGHTAAAIVFLGVAVRMATPPGRWRSAAYVVVGLWTAWVATCLVYCGFHRVSDIIGSVLLAPILLSWVALTPAFGEATRDRPRAPANGPRSLS